MRTIGKDPLRRGLTNACTERVAGLDGRTLRILLSAVVRPRSARSSMSSGNRRIAPAATVDGQATEGQHVRPAGSRRAPRGALSDGVVAGIPHRVVVHRRGVPDDDLRRAPPRDLPRRRGGAHARPQVVEGRRRAVRRRCRVGHDPELRDGSVVARHDGDVRRRDRPAVRARGHRLLRRGGVHRHLPVRVGPPSAQGAPAHADPDHRVSGCSARSASSPSTRG